MRTLLYIGIGYLLLEGGKPAPAPTQAAPPGSAPPGGDLGSQIGGWVQRISDDYEAWRKAHPY